jgi:hypothetical protein
MMKVGRIKNLGFDRQKKWFGSSHFEGFLILRARFADSKLEMAPSKLLKLVSTFLNYIDDDDNDQSVF